MRSVSESFRLELWNDDGVHGQVCRCAAACALFDADGWAHLCIRTSTTKSGRSCHGEMRPPLFPSPPPHTRTHTHGPHPHNLLERKIRLKDGFSVLIERLMHFSASRHPLSFLFFFQFSLVGQITPIFGRALLFSNFFFFLFFFLFFLFFLLFSYRGLVIHFFLLHFLALLVRQTPSSQCAGRCRTSSSSCCLASDFSVSLDIEIASSLQPTACPLPLSRVLPPSVASALLHLFHSADAAVIVQVINGCFSVF